MSEQRATQRSPFPGMDPFLEEPARWSSVHTRLINAISDQLAERVSPNFYVEIEERIVVAATDPDEANLYFEPDVYLTRGQEFAAQPVPATVIEVVHPEEIRQRYLEVRDSFNHEVITTIELLSPFNKAGGKRGHVDFLKKRRQMMATNVHWLEIDLLRAGLRPPEVTGKSDYYALLKRGGVLRSGTSICVTRCPPSLCPYVLDWTMSRWIYKALSQTCISVPTTPTVLTTVALFPHHHYQLRMKLGFVNKLHYAK